LARKKKKSENETIQKEEEPNKPPQTDVIKEDHKEEKTDKNENETKNMKK